MPPNLPDAAVTELLAQVQADAEFPNSIWADPRYAPLLPLILAASANHARQCKGDVQIECARRDGERAAMLGVLGLTTADRVFFGCSTCNRQAFTMRTEIRNRVRYPGTRCESCDSLEIVAPALASLIAADPETGLKRHPSRITAGSTCVVHFHCREAGCSNVVCRRVKRLAANDELPVCERHRRRGGNFA